MPDGTFNAVLVFDCEGSNLKFNSGKSLDEAESQVFSDQIPMLIDESMILSARALLDGKKLWIKSPLWYDSAGNRISGKKYVEVTVSDVKPGSIAFPLKVCFVDESGKQAWAMLNFGNSARRAVLSLTYSQSRISETNIPLSAMKPGDSSATADWPSE